MTALTVDECKRIIMRGKKQLTAAERRIAELESLVRDMDYCLLNYMSCDQCENRPCRLGERVKELGLRGRGGAR